MNCESCKSEYRVGCLCGLCLNCIQKYGHTFLHKALCNHLTKKKVINMEKLK